jgi:hypothetical protein
MLIPKEPQPIEENNLGSIAHEFEKMLNLDMSPLNILGISCNPSCDHARTRPRAHPHVDTYPCLHIRTLSSRDL